MENRSVAWPQGATEEIEPELTEWPLKFVAQKRQKTPKDLEMDVESNDEGGTWILSEAVRRVLLAPNVQIHRTARRS